MNRTPGLVILLTCSIFAAGALAQQKQPPKQKPGAEPRQSAAAAKALEQYSFTCQPCHGPEGKGVLPNTDLTSGDWKHGSSLEAITKTISEGVPGTAMLPAKDRFSKAEILELAKLVRSFDKTRTGKKPPKPKRSATADPKPDTQVVLTGCVAAANEGNETRFMLINAGPAPAGDDVTRSRAPETGSTGVGTTGTGTSGSGASASSTTAQDTAQVNVLLTTDGSLSLRRHVNRRVEVEGTMTRSAEAPNADAPVEMRITRLRRLSGACSGKK